MYLYTVRERELHSWSGSFASVRLPWIPLCIYTAAQSCWPEPQHFNAVEGSQCGLTYSKEKYNLTLVFSKPPLSVAWLTSRNCEWRDTKNDKHWHTPAFVFWFIDRLPAEHSSCFQRWSNCTAICAMWLCYVLNASVNSVSWLSAALGCQFKGIAERSKVAFDGLMRREKLDYGKGKSGRMWMERGNGLTLPCCS